MRNIAEMLYREFLRQKREQLKESGERFGCSEGVDISITLKKSLNKQQKASFERYDDLCSKNEYEEKIEIIAFLLNLMEQD